MPTIPLFALGKHITSFLFVPMTVNASTGSLTATTPTVEFYGVMQDCEIESSFTMENLSAMDRPYENNVPIEAASSVRLTEYEKSSGTCLAALAAFGETTPYFQYTAVRGSHSFVGYGVLSSYKMSATKPKVMASLEFKPIDPGGTLALVYT